MEAWTAHFAHDTAMLAVIDADPSDDPTGLDRAITALHMFSAVTAIEEIEDALVRLTHGGYGICQSCDAPIPFERLQIVPQARFCAACPTADHTSALSRRDHRTDDDFLLSSAPAVSRVVDDPRVLDASRVRDPSSVGHERSREYRRVDEQASSRSREAKRDGAVS
jgi:DnaK suppressor protein